MRDPDALRHRAGVYGNPDHDQHFLVDERVLDRLPEYLPSTRRPKHVLEIGAGTGALTDRLLSTATRVTAVERDPKLVEFLREEFSTAIADDTLQVIAGNAREVEFPNVNASVSNLPYSVASDIAFRLLTRRIPSVATFQLEFAERMIADAGTSNYGRLSVMANHYAEVEIVEIVPSTAFDPQPAVESAVVRIRPDEPNYSVPDNTQFRDLVKALFTQRRKTVRNGLRNTTHISGIAEPERLIDRTDEQLLTRRPDALEPEEFARLARHSTDLDEFSEP